MAGSRDVQVRITSQFEDRGFKSAEASAKAFERELAKLEQAERSRAAMQMQASREMAAAEKAAAAQRVQAMNTVANAVGALGLAMTAFAGLAVAKWAQFDAAMSNVAATGDDARGSLEALKDAALEAGQRTAFSATEAAGAIENLAKAGMSAEDILNGGLNGALDLAAAGGLEVAQAAEFAAIAMAQFNLSGEDMGHVADLMAAAAGKANGDVEDMGAALKQAGLIAAQTGLSIEETAATLAAFAEAGLLGSDAGTSLKTMLQRLSNPAGEAAEKMAELGISAYDAQGNFVGMESLAGQLRDSLAGLTPEARNAALAIIFGADATRAASVLYEEGAEGIATWTAAVDDQGYAAEAAATRMDNLRGDLEQLSGAFDTFLIRMGEGGDGPLRGLVQGVTDVVTALGNMPGAAQGALLAIVGGGGLVMVGAAGLVKLVTAVNEAKVAMDALKLSTGKTGTALAALGKGAVIIGVASIATALADAGGAALVAKTDVDDLAAALAGLGDGDPAQALVDLLSVGWGPFRNEADSTAEAMDRFGVAAASALGQDWANRFDRFMDMGSAFSAFRTQTEQLDGALASLVSSGNADAAAEAFQMFAEAAAAQGVDVSALVEMFPEYAAALDAAGTSAEGATEGVDGTTGALTAQEQAAANAEAAIQALIDAMDALNGRNLSLLEAQIAYEASVDSITASLEENGATLDLHTESGRANMETLTGLAREASTVAQATLEATGSQDQFRASLDVSRAALADAAMSFGMTSEEAWAFVDSVLAVPPAASTDVSAPGAVESEAQLDDVTTSAGEVDSSDPNVNVTTTDNASGTLAHIRQVVDGIPRLVTINIVTRETRIATGGDFADGGTVEFFAGGGTREHHTAQIAPAGAMRVWAEPETGGEAYIPLAPSKRARSEAILEDVADRFGMRVERYGSGGIRGGGAVSAGDLRAALDGATLHLGRIDPITGAVKAQLRLEQQRRAGI